MYNHGMDTNDTLQFLKEREEALGGRIRYRTYCTWYARIGHEKREYGVFLYTDGKTMMYEDFDRDPQILGIPIKRRNKEKYEKLSVSFPVSTISSIDQVRLSDAERSFQAGRDAAGSAGALARALCKLVTKITLDDGTVIFFEMMDHKGFIDKIKEFKEEP